MSGYADTEYPRIPRGALAIVIAQVVHFTLDDYAGNPIPEAVEWNAAYISACFIAQHTVDGHEGVETEGPWKALQTMKHIPFSERLALAERLVEEWGGESA